MQRQTINLLLGGFHVNCYTHAIKLRIFITNIHDLCSIILLLRLLVYNPYNNNDSGTLIMEFLIGFSSL